MLSGGEEKRIDLSNALERRNQRGSNSQNNRCLRVFIRLAHDRYGPVAAGPDKDGAIVGHACRWVIHSSVRRSYKQDMVGQARARRKVRRRRPGCVDVGVWMSMRERARVILFRHHCCSSSPAARGGRGWCGGADGRERVGVLRGPPGGTEGGDDGGGGQGEGAGDRRSWCAGLTSTACVHPLQRLTGTLPQFSWTGTKRLRSTALLFSIS